MDCKTPSEAIAVATRVPRSSSANYLIGHADGLLVDLESEPGGPHQLHVVMPGDDGVLVHTNHFLSRDVGERDLSVWSMPDSPLRLDRAHRMLRAKEEPFGVATAASILSDHGNFPTAICCHPDLDEEEVERGATIVSVAMELERRLYGLRPGTRARRRISSTTWQACSGALERHPSKGSGVGRWAATQATRSKVLVISTVAPAWTKHAGSSPACHCVRSTKFIVSWSPSNRGYSQ